MPHRAVAKRPAARGVYDRYRVTVYRADVGAGIGPRVPLSDRTDRLTRYTHIRIARIVIARSLITDIRRSSPGRDRSPVRTISRRAATTRSTVSYIDASPPHSHGYAQTVVANKVASHSYGEVKLNDMILWGSYCYSACSCIAE